MTGKMLVWTMALLCVTLSSRPTMAAEEEESILVGNDYGVDRISYEDQSLLHVSSIDDAAEYICRNISDRKATVEFIYDDAMNDYGPDFLSEAIVKDVLRKNHLSQRVTDLKRYCRMEWGLGDVGSFHGSEYKFHYTRGWSIPVYRLYNKKTGDHRYTTSESASESLKGSGWNDEGRCWTANKSDYGYPIYAVRNPNSGDWHYTTAKKEHDYLVSVGWQDEGVAFYQSQMDTVPLYRLYNPNAKTGAHLYTKSVGEKNPLVRLGWKYEGVAWYVF